MAVKKKSKKTAAAAAPAKPLPTGWSWFANGPLKGLGLMRERLWIYAWDDAQSIYILNITGELIAQRQAPKEVISVHAAETGRWVVAISRQGEIWWLNSSLDPSLEVRGAFTPLAVALEPQGDYALVTGQEGQNLICTSAGKKRAEFTTTRPLKHVAFAPETGVIVAAADNGLVGNFDLDGEEFWKDALWSNVSDLTINGDGSAILLACHGHGLIRYNDAGTREGTYRLDHSPSLVASDYAGARLIVGSLENYLSELTFGGQVKGTKFLSDPLVGLEIDALGRFVVMGFANGEVRLTTLAQLFGDGPMATATSSMASAPTTVSTPTAHLPAWETKVVDTVDAAATVVLAPIPETNQVAVFTDAGVLKIYDEHGELSHQSAPLAGAGRVLRNAPGWLLAATDRRLVAYDPVKNESTDTDHPLYSISHIEPFADFGDVLVIESCDRVTRLVLPDAPRWHKEMEFMVDHAATLPSGHVGVTLQDKNLLVYDGKGQRIGKFRAQKPEPMNVLPAADGWTTIAREEKAVRRHEVDGKLLWASSLPWAPWSTKRVGEQLIVTNDRGHSCLIDADGKVVAGNQEAREGAQYFLLPTGAVGRIFQTGDTLIVTRFDGQLVWRHQDEHQIGPFVAGPRGVWVMIRRLLTFFPFA